MAGIHIYKCIYLKEGAHTKTTKTVKTCDLTGDIAAKLFVELNPGDLCFTKQRRTKVLISKKAPQYLVYPEGWYFAKGAFRNKHYSTTGIYEEIPLLDERSGEPWPGAVLPE